MNNSENQPLSKVHALRAHIRRRTADVANFTAHLDAQERLAEGYIHPVRALVLRAILATPGLPQFIQYQVYGKHYQAAGLDIIGIGYHAVTISDGPNSVRKFYRTTAGASEADQQAAIDIWNKKHEILLTHLGEYTVPQFFSITENPVNKKESVVTAVQARVDAAGALSMWRPDDIPNSAADFISDSLALSQLADPAAPDLMGHNNALIERHTGAIKLIDPIPFVMSDPMDEKGFIRTERFLRAFKTKKEDA